MNTAKIPFARVMGVAIILILPFLFSAIGLNYAVLICCFAALYIVAVSGLDIVFGYCGQISMGHAAFFAIGAYSSIIINKHIGIPIFFSMILGAIIATVIGALLAYPASKLVFHFLALATIAFSEIVYQLISQSPGRITGDFTGLFTKHISFFGFKLDSYTRFYYFGLICVAIFLVIKTNLIKSRLGRSFLAIRENAHAADGMGINVKKYKIIAFAVSAFYTAFAGAMYAHLVRFVSPDTFTLKQSVMFLTMLLFGGSASLGGPVCGVVAVLLLNEMLRSAERYQMLIYGILLLVVIMLMPGGIYGKMQELLSRRKEAKQHAES